MTSVMPGKKKLRRPAPPTPEEAAAARTAAKRLLDKAQAFIVLDHTFFATVMLKHPMTESLRVPTLAVSPRGDIFYNPVFVAQCTAEQMVWAISHEVLHYMAGHSLRRQARDPKKWNYATDAWINDTLTSAKVGAPIEGCVDMPGSKDKTEETIYAELPENEDGDGPGEKPGGGGGDDGEPAPLEDDLENGEEEGEGEGEEGTGPNRPGRMSQSEMDEIDSNRKIEVAEAVQTAKMKGKLPGALAAFAAATIQSKIPWYDVLERHMTDRIQTDTSWARPNRRYAPEFYLPIRDNEGSLGEIVLQTDISGSISAQEIAHYNGQMKRIIEQCKPSKVHVIYTDTDVQKHEVFDKPEDVEIKFHSGGGTHMPAGFDYVKEQGIDPAVFVCFTDGYTDFGDAPDYPVVWCISSKDITATHGESVHFDMSDV